MGSDGFGYWPDVAPPLIVLPADPASVVGSLGFTIVTNSFIASVLTHAQTDFQITSGPGGSGTVLWQALADTGLLLKVVPALALSAGTRYLRVRYRSSTGKESAWSADKVLTVS